MMSVAPVASAGEAAGYYSNSDNYYFLGSLQSLWMGEGAKEQGLEGNVRGDDLTAVLEGRLPDGSRLGREVNGQHVHRPGHDLTFSAPKSVSILALIGNDKAMLEAHNHAVRVAAGYVEKLISARVTKDGVTSIVHTGKMVAAAYTHDTSRNLDPQLHTHLLIANMTEYAGKWKALATDYIHNAGFIETVMKHQVTLGKIYRSALRQHVEALGHEVEETGKNGLWEIKGIPEEVREEYSSRGREIQGAVGAEATLRSRDVAAKDTRRAKVDPSRLRLMERWLGQMKEKGFDLKAYQQSVVPRDAGLRDTPPQPERVSPATPVHTGPESLTPEATPQREKRPESQAVAADRNTAERQSGAQHTDPLTQPVQAGPGKTPAARTSLQAQLLHAQPPQPDMAEAVRLAVSQLSDSKTRFTFGELMLTSAELSERLPEIKDIRVAIDAALKDGMIVPLDSEKGVFTSRIHLLDELSIQALSQEHLNSTHVASFTRPEKYAPSSLEIVEKDALVLMNAPAGVAGIRELATQITDLSSSHGREVRVLASSAERATSLAKSDPLRERLISRQHVLSGDFALKPQSTLIIEGAERLGLKETLVLMGEARNKDAQLVFLDSAGRQANGNAMSVLEAAGVTRSRLSTPAPGLEAEVISIADKRNRYDAMASRYAELSAGTEPVTAIVMGPREQKHMTGLIRDALQNAGQLERDGITVEARSPVWLDTKTRRMPGSYRSGQVLEDRTDARTTRHYIIDRVHDDTRMLSLIDGDGVLSRHKISSLTADWRLYNSEQLSISTGEKLVAVAGDRAVGLKAKDRLQVTGFGKKGIEADLNGQKVTLPADRPLYVKHAYVAAPGGRDNDRGVVLAALNTREITAQTMNSLAQSGHRAEVFTAETQDRAEARLHRMRDSVSPVQLVRRLSGKGDVSGAVEHLRSGVKNDAALAVWRAVEDQRGVAFSELALTEQATQYHPDVTAVGTEINALLKKGDLLPVSVGGEPLIVARASWEMEKAILRVISEGKNTRDPLIEHVDAHLLEGLTAGQKQAATLVLGSRDQFTGIQGYAGTGKTTQIKAVKAAVETLPEGVRPLMLGLGPTHQAVKELKDTGMPAQTVKSFLVEHDQLVTAGEKPDYRNHLFLIDESSMSGNQDTAALFQAISDGGGRAVSMGDVDQFEAIDSGSPFKLMQERSPMDVAVMKEIVRQKDMQLKGAVHDIIDNRIDAALRRIEALPVDRVPREPGTTVPDASIVETAAPVKNIVRDWIGRTPDARGRTLIITQLNKDRHAVNAGIYTSLSKRGELGDAEITVPVLDKISHTRHEFNSIKAWETGMVVRRGDRYQDVVAVDRNGETVIVRDEEGKTGMYSPRQLITGDVELFTRDFRQVRPGVELRFTATDRERGQTGNQRFTVQSISDKGELVLKGPTGSRIINPVDVRAEQHIDYAWAVTGYGAQGASSDYVISLEGTESAREYLATRRAFYISASRGREHVQIYTDGLAEWAGTVKTPESDVKTAHDALKPETRRQQARAIWAMGQSVSSTAIGRTWSRHQSVDARSLTAKIIPATRRFPEPALALPLYNNNGKSAGLALISLVPGADGRLTQGDLRMVATEEARGGVLQRSRTGNTIVASDLAAALDALRNNPEDGVVWQTGDEPPSSWLLKVSGGIRQDAPQSIVTTLNDSQNALQQREQMLAEQIRNEEAGRSKQPETGLKDVPQEEVVKLKPEDVYPRKPGSLTPDAGVIARVREGENAEEREMTAAVQVRSELAGADKASGELARASRVIADLANAERDIIRIPDNAERGRMPEHDEQTLSRTIQKER